MAAPAGRDTPRPPRDHIEPVRQGRAGGPATGSPAAVDSVSTANSASAGRSGQGPCAIDVVVNRPRPSTAKSRSRSVRNASSDPGAAGRAGPVAR